LIGSTFIALSSKLSSGKRKLQFVNLGICGTNRKKLTLILIDLLFKTNRPFNLKKTVTRWLYCVECPQYSTRRRSASNIQCCGILRKNR